MQLSLFLQRYLKKEREHFAPGEWEVHTVALQRLLEYFGDVEVADITTSDMRRFAQYLVINYSRETREVMTGAVKRALDSYVHAR